LGRGALLCLPLGILLCRWFLPLAGELSVFVAERSPEGWIIQTAQKTDILPGMEANAVRVGTIGAVVYRSWWSSVLTTTWSSVVEDCVALVYWKTVLQTLCCVYRCR